MTLLYRYIALLHFTTTKLYSTTTMRYYTNRHTTINVPYNALAVYGNTSPDHTVHSIAPTMHYYTAPLQDFSPHYRCGTLQYHNET